MNVLTAEASYYTVDSVPITVKQSSALPVLPTSGKIEHGPPEMYCLPTRENVTTRNEFARTRKLYLGSKNPFHFKWSKIFS